MSANHAARTPTPASSNGNHLHGLVPPKHRGRSQRLIGDIIVELGFARREVVERAVAMSREQGRPTGKILIESGELRHDQLARVLAERFGVDYIDLSVFEVDPIAIGLITSDMAKHYQAVPVRILGDDILLVAMADPTNVITIDELSMITGMTVRPAATASEDINALITRLTRIDDSVTELEEPQPEVETQTLEDLTTDAPVVKLVHSIIAQAVERGASDVHFDPEADDMRVLFRIDGVLTRAATVPSGMAAGVISRIKIMSSLDIAERRVPQDGRMAITIDGRRIDTRVVTLPLVKGEGVVMRILDTGLVLRDLESLGMDNDEKGRFLTAVRKPHGAVLVTGPTGSGKSTTLYGALGVINDGQRSIITIEDPVESQIAGIKQMQVSAKAGVSFATGLRSMLRADPDVIMVGEIRDRETAEIAVQAALTGHLVLSTLHTRNAASALTRLLDMGIEPFMVAAAIDCVVAQRLARTLCAHCKAPDELTDAVRAQYGLQGADVFQAAGCIRCGWTGYHGRVGLYEIMPVTEEIRTMLLDRRGLDEIAAAAVAAGMRTMRDDGIDKVRKGLTSLVEIGRVTNTF
jgi:type IV pilus assembly protein PilB